MIELPEAAVLAKQSNEIMRGKRIRRVVAAQNPQRLAWYFGEPQAYNGLLAGKVIGGAVSHGGHVEIAVEEMQMAFSAGVSLRYLKPGESAPNRHQLLLDFEDGSFLVCTVRLYGALMVFTAGANDNKYYLVSREKPSPLMPTFDEPYFGNLLEQTEASMSLKGFLATEQRIPGLGNGVLHDILFNAAMHPKRKVGSLAAIDRNMLYGAVKDTLLAMVAAGGRDTEIDLLGQPGGFASLPGRYSAGRPCAGCGTPIMKESYMGGSIYYCARCQEL